jgi:hypothetical protein
MKDSSGGVNGLRLLAAGTHQGISLNHIGRFATFADIMNSVSIRTIGVPRRGIPKRIIF